MIVGVCRLVFALPGVSSLKEKRSIVRKVIDRVRAKFNVAIAEVASMDSHRQAVIGLAVVSNESRHANSMIDTIVSYVSRYVTLEPGDVIFTGTPGTTQAMKPGDVFEVEIQGVGVLRNTVVAERR